MGTSTSYSGPGTKPPLLPSWAIVPSQGETGSPSSLPLTDDPNQMLPVPSSLPPQDPLPMVPSQESPIPELTNDQTQGIQGWTGAKKSFATAISQGGRRSSWQNAGSRYVRALGGSNKAARSSVTARGATTAFGRFLVSMVTQGFDPTIRKMGLSEYLDQSPEVIMTAIINALAPEGATREQAVARRAICDGLNEIYVKYVLPQGTFDALGTMPPQAIKDMIIKAVGSYIYRRWVSDLGLKIEEKAVSPQQAINLERQVKKFVFDAVRFDLKDHDVLKMNWQGTEGKKFVNRIYVDAYSLIGGGE